MNLCEDSLAHQGESLPKATHRVVEYNSEGVGTEYNVCEPCRNFLVKNPHVIVRDVKQEPDFRTNPRPLSVPVRDSKRTGSDLFSPQRPTPYHHKRSKLTPQQRDEIKVRAAEGVTSKQMALDYGVSVGTINLYR